MSEAFLATASASIQAASLLMVAVGLLVIVVMTIILLLTGPFLNKISACEAELQEA